LTLAPPPFLLRFRLKINKNEGMILGKFQSGSTPGTSAVHDSIFQRKNIIKE
jgi:hypothetical protein